MARLETRSRAGYLLLAAIVGHVLLISAQVNSKSGVPILEAVTFGVFAELERSTAAVTGSVRHGWSDYVGLRQARAENETLKRQLADAQIQLQEQRALADRTRSLAQMLELREGLELKTTAADIIGAGSTPDFRTVTIDKGVRQGLRRFKVIVLGKPKNHKRGSAANPIFQHATPNIQGESRPRPIRRLSASDPR